MRQMTTFIKNDILTKATGCY